MATDDLKKAVEAMASVTETMVVEVAAISARLSMLENPAYDAGTLAQITTAIVTAVENITKASATATEQAINLRAALPPTPAPVPVPVPPIPEPPVVGTKGEAEE